VDDDYVLTVGERMVLMKRERFQTAAKNHEARSKRQPRWLVTLVFLPVVTSIPNSAPPVATSWSSNGVSGHGLSRYRTRITQCRYPAIADVSVILASMKHFSREEFSSSLKRCLEPPAFRRMVTI
jgi:hypothetical protein